MDCDEQSPRQGNRNRDIPEPDRRITEKAKTLEHNHGEWGDENCEPKDHGNQFSQL
jgi:hypothetical protein